MSKRAYAALCVAAHVVAGAGVHLLTLLFIDTTAWMQRRTASLQRINANYIEYFKGIYGETDTQASSELDE